MRRGGYNGGSTVVGPHTPGWFGSNGVLAPEPADAAPRSPGAPKPRPSLTAADEARISNLRVAIAGTRAELQRAEQRLADEREELIKLLGKYDLPLERYPETGL